ncbi:MAG: SUMF1/EgtB/PvdO family nonheme iron enzyme [Planctomycetes bacterium]|nr:SUMF1/EgtB/PvdO family nonheme iron enzyme [Planctomycetota bacterium]
MTNDESTGKYVPGPEIGRGGLSRVVEAHDREIGRTVALKLLLDGAPLDVVERFRREGRLTGRLQHPNIVPVYDIGALPGGAGRSPELFLAMKKIAGRDMGLVIRELRRGAGGETWTQRRLVEALRDACRAVAYAHSQGVIHRDLKPTNVMLGEFGEVLVVDWGLAKERGESEAAGKGRTQAWQAQMTLAGDVVGTPEYMAPEQASGRSAEVDERSDVYALGAILYEILAWRPPFRGDQAESVLEQVRTSTPIAPSIATGQASSSAGERRPPARLSTVVAGERGKPPPVPPELEDVCMRSLSRDPAARFQTARDFGAALDAWLSGTAERERCLRIADAQVVEARGHAERWRKLAGEARESLRECIRMAAGIPRWGPVERLREMWALEDRSKDLERESVLAFAEADAALSSALSNCPDHAAARALKAGIWADRFRAAEERSDAKEMVLARRMIEEYDDGAHAAFLSGEGTLEIRTRAYPCRCLLDGRTVSPAELNVGGYHPWSGRRLDGSPSEGAPALEPAGPLRLRVHANSCAPVPAEGARAWAFRYEESGRLFFPVTPPDTPAGDPVPPRALDALFGDSPFRPQGPGACLGLTPVARRPWPMGSWLLVLVPDDGPPLRVPLAVSRCENAALDVTLYRHGEIPDGFLPVAAGPFLFQFDPSAPPGNSERLIDVDDVFVARDPVTCAAYLASLEALDAGEAARRAPRRDDEGPPYWRVGSGARVLADASTLRDTAAPWRPDWPVVAVSWLDAVAFAARASRDRLFTLPDEIVWEKAARGADRRACPWGNEPADPFAVTNSTHPDGQRPRDVGDFPTDESPWGVRGLAGNSADLLLNETGRDKPQWRSARGGRWCTHMESQRAFLRVNQHFRAVSHGLGFRLCAPVRLSGVGARPELNWKRGVTGKR